MPNLFESLCFLLLAGWGLCARGCVCSGPSGVGKTSLSASNLIGDHTGLSGNQPAGQITKSWSQNFALLSLDDWMGALPCALLSLSSCRRAPLPCCARAAGALQVSPPLNPLG